MYRNLEPPAAPVRAQHRLFQRAIRDVGRYFDRVGLRRIYRGVRRISVVRQESYHDIRNRSIGLNPRDVRRPFAAIHSRAYLLIHELGHHFAEVRLSRADRRQLAPLFGLYDAPYRRAPKPRRADADHVSRYSMTHPAEDFAESFAVCIWRDWDPAAVDRLMRGKSAACARKLSAISRLLRQERRLGGR